jgi:hypothetical protein
MMSSIMAASRVRKFGTTSCFSLRVEYGDDGDDVSFLPACDVGCTLFGSAPVLTLAEDVISGRVR